MEAPPLLVTDVAKTYGVVQALRPASLELARGEVHALVGENGSGKSTLVGIVSGTVKPDGGTVAVGGAECRRHTPWESQRNGVLTVFQDGSVIPELSIAQNLFLGTPVADRPAYRRAEAWAAERLAGYDLGRLDVGSRAGLLSPGDRQLFEIVRAVAARPAVLLLDEATSALDAAGVDVALALMTAAAAEGCAVLFVTHRLSEVFRVADRISVLRDGAWQGTHAAAGVDQQRLIELMAGTSVDVEFPARARPEEIGEPVVVARRLAGPRFGPVDVELRPGEIVGIAGADDNGQLELLRGLGSVEPAQGSVEVKGRTPASYPDAVAAGVVLLSGDRRNESLFQSLSIRENLVAGMLGKIARGGVVSWSGERSLVQRSIDRFGIRLGSPEHPITSLSGGNQQKVALGRVLATEPEVLLIDEPTQGVDVRSRIDIYTMLREATRAGLSVILVSSDAAELAGLCDRILVMSRGRVVAELAGEGATEESIVGAFTVDGPAAVAVGDPAAAPAVSADEVALRRSGPVRRLLTERAETARLLLLVVLLLVIGLYAYGRNETFGSTQSIYNILLLALPLAAVAAAEYIVLFAGGIDVSVGASMGVMVALLSYTVTKGSFLVAIILALVIAIAYGTLLGAVNASLVEGIQISPVIATIATLGILQGIGLALRPTAAGTIAPSLTTALTDKVWVFPVPLLVLAVLFVAADRWVRSSGRGLGLRSVGLNPQFAYRLGVNAPRLRQLSYIGCAIVAGFAGILLSAQVGVGDSTVGNDYTLLAVAAPVLGGASLLGGYGSFVGCLLGAVLLALAQTLPTTLDLNDAASFLLTGGLTLLALLIYTSGASATLRGYLRTLMTRVAPAR